MALVDYSDSDDSESEQTPVVKTTANTAKSTFQKVVDRSNPGKIRVSLPQTGTKDDANGDEPPSKRAKIGGGGGFGGFNSFLPPPKRPNQASTVSLGAGKQVRSNGLGAGVSLKTGAAPGFSREPEPEYEEPTSHAEDNFESTDEAPRLGGGMALPPPQAAKEEVKLVGKPLMFKPLSVSRKPAKKKKPVDSPASATSSMSINSTESKAEAPPRRQKISLFSVSSEPSEFAKTSVSHGQYEPMIYGTTTEEEDKEGTTNDQPNTGEGGYTQTSQYNTSAPAMPKIGAQSLNDIASDLHLSAAERRQLFGRQKGGRNGGMQSATNVINFNTDEEYKHNEELRAAGEQVMHNPVRAIAPGKHNLKQLVNAAASQKEALEESFAKGKSNRAEASSRYGW